MGARVRLGECRQFVSAKSSNQQFVSILRRQPILMVYDYGTWESLRNDRLPHA